MEGFSYVVYCFMFVYQNCIEVLYVVVNDGMFYVFDSENGNEFFVYMLGELLMFVVGFSYVQIFLFMLFNYIYCYFMDGLLKVFDVYINIDGVIKWCIVLVGSMGVGGCSVFVIDIINLNSVDKNKVFWEFNYLDFGFGVLDLEIVWLLNGDWVVIFGNGYNGDDEKVSLFVV